MSRDFKRRKILIAVKAPTTTVTNKKSILLEGLLHIGSWLIR
jgi:hypothetical protein